MKSTRINCSLATEFALVQENILLQNERITQLFVIQSEQNPFLWFGVLFVDAGIYKGAVIRFSMYIDDSYPDCSCPKIVFDPIPYHPLVNPVTGELDTKNAFPGWNSNSRKLYELLLFVKRAIRQADDYIAQIREFIFNSMNKVRDDGGVEQDQDNRVDHHHGHSSSRSTAPTDDPFLHPSRSQRDENVIATNPSQNNISNKHHSAHITSHLEDTFEPSLKGTFTWFHHTLDFVETYENDTEEFTKRVEELKRRCFEQLLDRPALCGDDRNALVFTPWDREVHEPVRSCVLAGRFTPSSLFATYHKETEQVSFVPGHEPGPE